MPKTPESGSRRIARRLIILAAVVGVAAFAIEGGEWGTVDLMRQTSRMQSLEHEVDSLQHIVDSLKTYRRRLGTDPALQERIAREEFGMVKGNKELLYRFSEPRRP
ncbi:MAG: septum formation initiator family protein [Gemmatimonadetes bacterium]|nr:septum formation initiator family protein [Gemmatimonadota bacterium]